MKKKYELTNETMTWKQNGKTTVLHRIKAVKDDGISPIEAIERYSYTDNRPEPTESAMMATVAVFEQGQTVTDEPIKYFYAPQRVSSKFHESQEFVMELNGHRFFSEKEV